MNIATDAAARKPLISSSGTFSLPNIVFEDKYFTQTREFSRAEALAWIAKNVRWTDNCVLKRGQGRWAERYLADAWGWARTKVQRFLKRLESMNLIRLESGPGAGPVEKVITYLFSKSSSEAIDESGPAPGHDRASSGPKTKSGNTGNEDSPCSPPEGDDPMAGLEPQKREATGAGSSTSVPPSSEPAESPQAASPPVPPPPSRKPRAKRDPINLDGWRPKETTIAQMREETGASVAVVEWELRKMIDWCRTTTKPVKDLEARFRNWMRSWKDKQAERRPSYAEQKKAEYAI